MEALWLAVSREKKEQIKNKTIEQTILALVLIVQKQEIQNVLFISTQSINQIIDALENGEGYWNCTDAI